ncbi:hypothetical protein MLD38_039996 [Melastoma candidum]|uniref:Uncharacterized protein n=1 Tax=Melastoma candidum TaxID=119954 RepID=A0ACB9L675_9MYRT|nr:hypothetical protein MLD38_039996 [Melastoma candidum]
MARTWTLPVIDWAESSGVKQFLFTSSAGIYKPTEVPPHLEGEVVKASAGHVGVEQYLAEVYESWAVFRPQYMIGSGNKDCEEWFFDRIVRDRPNSSAASGNIFYCVSDRAVTLDGMAKLCAQAAGKSVNIVHYDPESIGIDSKKAFPSRNMHFYTEPRAAKAILGWKGTTNLPEDLKERYKEYVKIGRDKKPMEFALDDKILESLKVPVAA